MLFRSELAPEAVRSEGVPAHATIEEGDTETDGSGFIVTLTLEDAEQLPLVTVTVYVPPEVTVMELVVAPVDQEKESYPEETDKTVELPLQKARFPEMTGVMSVATFTVTEALPVQPLLLDTVTE